MDEVQRLFEKLDELSKDVANVAKEQARIEGTTKGVWLAVDTIKTAIGEVNDVKVNAALMGGKVDNLGAKIESLEKRIDTKDWKLWAERVVSGAMGGGGAALLLKVLG